MRVYLMQHAESKSKKEDPKKGLTDTGVENILKISAYLTNLENIKFSKIYHSGKKRAKDTAEIFEKNLNYNVEVKEAIGLKPNDNIQFWAEKLDRMEDVLLVSHLPYLDKLSSFLIADEDEKKIVKFQNAGLLCLEKSDCDWRVKWYLAPQLLI